ncbi:hypothetical protein V8E55_008734 [Tylopilus felleus]
MTKQADDGAISVGSASDSGMTASDEQPLPVGPSPLEDGLLFPGDSDCVVSLRTQYICMCVNRDRKLEACRALQEVPPPSRWQQAGALAAPARSQWRPLLPGTQLDEEDVIERYFQGTPEQFWRVQPEREEEDVTAIDRRLHSIRKEENNRATEEVRETRGFL